MLKADLVQIAFQQNAWGQRLPMAWVPLEQELSEIRSNDINMISLEQLCEINIENEEFSLTDKQFKHFLKNQHALGKLMYFDVPGLDRFIMVQPNSLVDILRAFITDEKFWPNEPILRSILETATSLGTIRKGDLLELWSQKRFKHHLATTEKKDYIMKLLVHLDVLVKPKRYHNVDLDSIDLFLIPCMIKQSCPTELLSHGNRANRSIFLSYRLLKSAIPNALAFKLIGAVLNIWPLKNEDGKMCLYHKAAILDIDADNSLYLTFSENRFLVCLTNRKSKTFITPNIASVLQECLTLTMEKVIEFYLMSFGNPNLSKEASKYFTIDVGEQCGEEICYISLSESKTESSWKCPHDKIHKTKYTSYWIYDKEETLCLQNCQGPDKEILALLPQDKHLVRLANQIENIDFPSFLNHIGLPRIVWTNIEDWPFSTRKYIALFEWKKHEEARNRSPTFQVLLKGLIGIGYSEHKLCEIIRQEFTQVYDFDNPRLQDTPTEIDLDKLSRKIGHHTFQLGVELDLDLVSIEETITRFPKDMFGQTFDILKKWKNNSEIKPTIRSLMVVLQYVDPKGFVFLKETYL